MRGFVYLTIASALITSGCNLMVTPPPKAGASAAPKAGASPISTDLTVVVKAVSGSNVRTTPFSTNQSSLARFTTGMGSGAVSAGSGAGTPTDPRRRVAMAIYGNRPAAGESYPVLDPDKLDTGTSQYATVEYGEIDGTDGENYTRLWHATGGKLSVQAGTGMGLLISLADLTFTKNTFDGNPATGTFTLSGQVGVPKLTTSDPVN